MIFRATLLLCGWLLITARVHAQTGAPLPLGSAQRPYVLYDASARVLRAHGASLSVQDRNASTPVSQLAFTLEPVAGAESDLTDGVQVRMRSSQGRYVTLLGKRALLTPHAALAARWQIARRAGAGALGPGEPFELRCSQGRDALGATQHSLSLVPAGTAAASLTLGCYFNPGPFSQPWSDRVQYHTAAAERVTRAVDWLRASAAAVRMPAGDLPLIVWDDPTLQPEPTVGYLLIDSLWAAKALTPYDPDLAEDMTRALLAAGWYGNGLADTLFHGVSELAHRPASADVAHGTWLDRCVSLTSGGPVQLRVPEQRPDADWTAGNSAQFVDSAVYTTLDAYWHDDLASARARLSDVLMDTRDSGPDTMFWDDERRVLVDQASRCDYDRFVGQCSTACPACGSCGDACFFYGASFKLGLLLYAARVIGLAEQPEQAARLSAIEQRLWEGQLAEGGIPHLAFYDQRGNYLVSSGATGEATAIAVLSQTVSP